MGTRFRSTSLEEVKEVAETTTTGGGSVILLSVVSVVIVILGCEHSEEFVVFTILGDFLFILRGRVISMHIHVSELEFHIWWTVTVKECVAEQMTVIALHRWTILMKMSQISAIDASCFDDSWHD